MATNLVSLRASREGYRTNAKKTAKKVDEALEKLPDALPSESEISVLALKLSDYAQKIEELDSKILPLLNADDMEEEGQKCADIADLIWTARHNATQIISQLSSPKLEATRVRHLSGSGNSTVYGSASGAVHNVKLPKLSLPKFDGNPLEWQPFWDSFDSTINQQNLSDIDKLKYLRSCLQGEASRLVEGFRLTGANYTHVVDALTERFGNPEIAIFAHFDELLALPTAANDTRALQAAYDTCEKHIRSLAALGVDEDTFGVVFTPIILSKLPRPTRIQLHRKNGADAWTLSNLRQLLREEIKAHQMGEWTINGGNSKSNGSTQHSSVQPRAKPHLRFPSGTALMQTNKRSSICCVFCGQGHYSDSCGKFRRYDERVTSAKRQNLCFKCLSADHLAAACQRQKKCFHCKSDRHNSALCPTPRGDQRPKPAIRESNAGPIRSNLNPNATGFTPKTNTVVAHASHKDPVYMQMAVTSFPIKGGRVSARVYLDPGSSCSYITDSLAKQLGLEVFGAMVVQNGRFEEEDRRTKSYQRVMVEIPTLDGSIEIDAFVTSAISPPVEKLPVDLTRYPIVQQIRLADPLVTSSEEHPIDILIGGDFYFQFVSKERIDLEGGLVVLGSRFGYLTAGRDKDSRINNQDKVSNLLIFNGCGPKRHNCQIERFWNLEDVGVREDPTEKDDDLAVKKFNESIQLRGDRYEVGWPWVSSSPELPANYQLALSRLRSVSKRLQSPDHTQVLKVYDETIRGQLADGKVEEVPEQQTGPLVHYLPHHCVVKPSSTTTKVRIVYDASSKASKDVASLNDCLLRGPMLLNDMCGILLRFRLSPIVAVSDIEKAYHMISLRPEDRDVTRFLWLKNPTMPPTPDNIWVLRFTRVIFGVVSSAFLLAATVRHHLNSKGGPLANYIDKNMYVDNCFGGFATVDEAKQYYSYAKSTFAEVSMNLREWFSNSADLMSSIPEVDRGVGLKTKVLGQSWDMANDRIGFPGLATSWGHVSTKRQLAENCAKVFDPCGLLSPLTILLKKMVQGTWREKLKWEDPVSEATLAEWHRVSGDMAANREFSLQRFKLGCDYDGPVYLHCFCDASKSAYAAAVYLLQQGKTAELCFAKARLAPVKYVSIPRLELMAAVVGAKLLRFVRDNLPPRLLANLGRDTLWIDSVNVLSWIRSTKVLPLFVANRVTQIRAQGADCRYVPSEENPADIPSKGMLLSDLADNTLWWSGPDFLLKSSSEWPPPPQQLVDVSDVRYDDPKLSPNIQSSLISQRCGAELGVAGMNPSNFSSLWRLLAVTAWILRFLKKIRRQTGDALEHGNFLCPKEVESARLAWILSAQSSFLSSASTQEVRNASRQLDLFRDEKGVLRCGGRLSKSLDIDYEAKHPVFLPKGHPFTKLVIGHYHRLVQHLGASHTLAEMRRRFWTPSGRSQVRSVIMSCQTCRIWEGGSYEPPKFPSLPEFRVSSTVPFQSVGVDYFGPIYVTQASAMPKKLWVCLFTCCVTRAIHLELVDDLSTASFLLSFRRFIATYGKPSLLISDNGKYFQLANNVLKKLLAEIPNADDVRSFLSKNEIVWRFIPEYAPWFGGFYERMVGCVKRPLRKILGRRRVDANELRTMLSEVCAIVNSRPLVFSSSHDCSYISPADLLGKRRPIGRCLGSDEDPDQFAQAIDSSGGAALVRSWKQLNFLVNQFWDIWRSEYLQSLRERSLAFSKKAKTQPLVATEGAVVLIKEHSARANWKMGIVETCHLSTDGCVRSVTIKLPNGRRIRRPIRLLFPIESSVRVDRQASSKAPTGCPNRTDESESAGDIGDDNSCTLFPADSLQPSRQSSDSSVAPGSRDSCNDDDSPAMSRRRPKRDSAIVAKCRIRDIANAEMSDEE